MGEERFTQDEERVVFGQLPRELTSGAQRLVEARQAVGDTDPVLVQVLIFESIHQVGDQGTRRDCINAQSIA